MKLCIPIDKTPHTGKAFFLHRLIPELEKLGVEVTLDKFKKVDITLGVGKFLYRPKSKKVLRLGPAHVSTHEDYKKLNKRKAKAVKIADGVIYQSEFSKKMCDEFLGKASCPIEIIYNGAPINRNPKKQRPLTFICSTRKWIPQKRLKTILKAWEICNLKKANLYVLGDTLGVNKYLKNVYYLGLCNEATTQYYLSKSHIMIHTVYLDAMPNSVVEALANKCRVVHTDSGGTQEIVRESGVRIQEKRWDFKPTNLLKPQKLDPYKLSKAMMLEGERLSQFENSNIDIKNIASQYYSFFQKVLNG